MPCSDAETGVLELLSAAQLLGQPELYAGGSSTRAKQLPPPPRGAQPTVAEVGPSEEADLFIITRAPPEHVEHLSNLFV